MDKSQLRLLARDFANGDIAFADYRRQREELIDDIVAGALEIERTPTPAAPPAPEPVPPPAQSSSTSSGPLSLQSILVGLLVLGLAVWLMYPTKREAPQFASIQPPEQTKTREAPGPGERIVAEFLRANAWGEYDLDQFLAAWVALTATERSEARQAGDVQRLGDALIREMKAIQAVYDLSPSTEKEKSLETLTLLAAALDVKISRVRTQAVEPILESQVSPAPLETVASSIKATAIDQLMVPATADPLVESVEPAQPEMVTDAQDALPLEDLTDENVTLTVVENSRAATSRWKPLDDVAGYTLQLFALSNTENVSKVLRTYPTLDLRVLTLAAGNARHRIVFGSFPAQAGAAAAYLELPTALTRDQPAPIIKSIEELRGLL